MKRKIEKNSKNNANKGKIDTENTKIVKKTNGEIREDLKTITYIKSKEQDISMGIIELSLIYTKDQIPPLTNLI